MVVDGEIVIRPMMYLALSYDHRLIDGREAVQFLVTIKEANRRSCAHTRNLSTSCRRSSVRPGMNTIKLWEHS